MLFFIPRLEDFHVFLNDTLLSTSYSNTKCAHAITWVVFSFFPLFYWTDNLLNKLFSSGHASELKKVQRCPFQSSEKFRCHFNNNSWFFKFYFNLLSFCDTCLVSYHQTALYARSEWYFTDGSPGGGGWVTTVIHLSNNLQLSRQRQMIEKRKHTLI